MICQDPARHLQGRETGTLVDGLSKRTPEEWQQVRVVAGSQSIFQFFGNPGL